MFAPEKREAPGTLQDSMEYEEPDICEEPDIMEDITGAPVREETPKATIPPPVKASARTADEDDEARRTLSNQSASTLRAHSLFFTPENDGRDFSSVLSDVQEYVSSKYSTLITESGGDTKEQIKRYIAKYVQDHRIAVKGLTSCFTWTTV